MKLGAALCALPLLGLSCSPLSSTRKPHVDPGRYTKTIQEGEQRRSYILRVPPQYDNKSKLPLVILFHGWGSNAAEAELYTRFGAKSSEAGFILAIPDGTAGIGDRKGWNTGFLNLGEPKADDVKLTSDLIDQVEKDVLIDENRVYIAGHSNGAMMAYDLGANLGDRVAAIAVVSGTIGVPDKRVTEPKGPVSAIIFHGKADPTVPYDDTTSGLIKCTPAPESAKWWAQKDGCHRATETSKDGGNVTIDDYPNGKNGSEVEFVTIANGTHAWPSGVTREGLETTTHVAATDMIWDFFKAHPKKS